MATNKSDEGVGSIPLACCKHVAALSPSRWIKHDSLSILPRVQIEYSIYVAGIEWVNEILSRVRWVGGGRGEGRWGPVPDVSSEEGRFVACCQRRTSPPRCWIYLTHRLDSATRTKSNIQHLLKFWLYLGFEAKADGSFADVLAAPSDANLIFISEG
ncbi:hypothetical protein O6H91_16G029300 [Diphasiastrum complanatum]|uniref:Uncharacterized protein n=1 Tax=Diphasiastrum complanatum TaxID=34168 RepID=A0ACC2BB32_DIPCM|nr:hypothetical protein O6H91_16G029300 [Diphasiastrum complanatum]